MCVCVCVRARARAPTLTYVSTCVSIHHVTVQIFVRFLVLFSKSTGNLVFLFRLGVKLGCSMRVTDTDTSRDEVHSVSFKS